MSALGAVTLLLGGITRVLDLTAIIICAMIIFVVREELRHSGWLVYAVIGVLAFILPIDKTIAVEYIVFAIYPMLKPFFDKLPRVIRLLIKLIFMIVSALAVVLIFRYVFLLVDFWYIDLAFGIGLVLIYFLFDISISRFQLYYRYKLRHQLRIDKFFH